MEMENERDYFKEGYRSIDKSLVKDLSKRGIEDLETNLKLMWILGYQKALLMNEKQNKKSNAKIESINFDFIKEKIDTIKYLSNSQQNQINDVDIKIIIVKKIIELYTYIYNQIH
ncbi:MAG: hypothetical protein VB130_08660 [Clostridium sp.]|nr:hypothetical protein [Clostridium sp.]